MQLPAIATVCMKQKLLSFQMKSGVGTSLRGAGQSIVKRNPTLNRLQNLLMHQRSLKKMEYIRRQRAQQSFVLQKMKQIARPRIDRLKLSLFRVPRTRAFRVMMMFPLAYIGMRAYSRYSDVNPDGHPGLASIRQSDGSYLVFGRRFESPK